MVFSHLFLHEHSLFYNSQRIYLLKQVIFQKSINEEVKGSNFVTPAILVLGEHPC